MPTREPGPGIVRFLKTKSRKGERPVVWARVAGVSMRIGEHGARIESNEVPHSEIIVEIEAPELPAEVLQDLAEAVLREKWWDSPAKGDGESQLFAIVNRAVLNLERIRREMDAEPESAAGPDGQD
jgi:hypothetical protein